MIQPENERSSGRKPDGWLRRNRRFIFKNRMYHPRYLRFLYRLAKFKLFHPGIKVKGMIFLPRKYDISKGKEAKFIIGAWTWIGRGCAFRAHEGTLIIGPKCTFGGNNVINCYLRVEVGPECLFADDIYVVDFDHWFIDPNVPIRSQGISKAPVILEGNIWVGEKATILKGVTVGKGAVVGAMALVNRDVPSCAIVGGVPARVIKYRRSPLDVAWDEGKLDA